MRNTTMSRFSNLPDRDAAIRLLKSIPADLPYPDWFRVAAALKNSGVEFEEFDHWSQTAPDKYDGTTAEQVWDDAAAYGKPEITLGTLRFIAAQYNGTIVPAPQEMLPPPETEEEQATQIAEFWTTMFRSGESFELVTKVGFGDKGRTFPWRSADQIFTLNDFANIDECLRVVQSCHKGAWISLNPVSQQIKGKAPTDSEVTDYRHALVEADDLSQDEQWQQLRELNLPILAVVWSGGKSLHIIVKIDAGNDFKLYRERIAKLYAFLEQKGFPADRANKNPSRLTRLPGVRREGDMQYLVSGSWGYPDWQSFEKVELSARTNSAEFPKKSMPIIKEESLISNYGYPFNITKSGGVAELNQNFFAAYTQQTQQLIYSDGYFWQYDQDTGLWRQVGEAQMNNLIAATIRAFGKQYNVDLSSKVSAPICRAIRSFMEPERIDPFKNTQCRYIHVANGVLDFSEEARVTMHTFAPEFYSRNRCEIAYDPEAKCPRFIGELLQPALPEDDIELLQLYCGQCLIADNLTQTFLVLTGTAGGGKGTIVRIIESVIGADNCVEMRTEQLGERFEIARFIGKTLLIGSDVPSSFLLKKYAGRLKSLCGHDRLTAEVKGVQEGVQLEGRFNMIITANDKLRLNIDGDAEAWKRRVLWIPFERPPVQCRIPDFDKILLQDEGAGILNWMVEGASKVLKTGIQRDGASARRLDGLLQESDSIYGFLRARVEKRCEKHAAVTVEELGRKYELWCLENDWQPLPMRIATGKLRDGIMALYQVQQAHDVLHMGRSVRGYHGLQFKSTCVLPDAPDAKKKQLYINEDLGIVQPEIGF